MQNAAAVLILLVKGPERYLPLKAKAYVYISGMPSFLLCFMRLLKPILVFFIPRKKYYKKLFWTNTQEI